MSSSPTSDSPLVVQTKNKANHLKSILRSRLPDISHGECLNIISKLERERDWNTYLAKLRMTASDGDHVNELDSYIKETTLPLIVSTAAKHYLKVIIDPSKIEDGETTRGRPVPRRISLRIEPQNQHRGETFCEPFLDVSMTSQRLYNDWFNINLNFIFPKEAFSVVTQIFSGDKIGDGDVEPQITRFETQQEQCYMLMVNTSSVSDSVDHGLSIFSDPKMHRIMQTGFDRFFSGYGKAAKAYSNLHGKWSNKRLVTAFENALRKMSTDDPPYMAVSNRFYSSTIAGLQFHGALGSAGPYILGPDGSVEIGVCSIIHLDDGEEGKPGGYYVAKYGSTWQTQIHLKGFGKSDVDRITAVFGIPCGHYSDETSFYQTPAFDALCDWTDKNPQYAKRVGRKGGAYLPDWYEHVLSRLSAGMKKSTNKDFLIAIEKEPYLIDFGIQCGSHIDRKKSAEENRAIFLSQRESFTNTGFSEFSICCEWLQGCNQRKTINSSFSSYRLKHMVEAWTRKTGRGDEYVSNGAFIAAAIHMGFDWKCDFDSPNVRFNISGRSPAITALQGTSIM